MTLVPYLTNKRYIWLASYPSVKTPFINHGCTILVWGWSVLVEPLRTTTCCVYPRPSRPSAAAQSAAADTVTCLMAVGVNYLGVVQKKIKTKPPAYAGGLLLSGLSKG